MCGICPIIPTTELPIQTSSCDLICLNGGNINKKLCRCECKNLMLNVMVKNSLLWLIYFNIGYPSYTGLTCENTICENEPAECKDTTIFSKSECSNAILSVYCPGILL
jgi:hypothetical protein